jgi:hypothetical protein
LEEDPTRKAAEEKDYLRNPNGNKNEDIQSKWPLFRGSPFGGADWVAQTAKKLGLESTLRSPGRPKSH